MSSGLVEWKCAVVITTTSQLHKKSYVDDLLKLIQDEQTAIKLIKHKRAVCAEEGFYFAKFLGNSKGIFLSIPDHNGFQLNRY